MHVLGLEEPAPRGVWNQYMRGGYSVWPVGRETVDAHCHFDAIELFIILDGQCEMTVEDEVQVIQPGQTVYVGPGGWHKVKAVGDRPLVMFMVIAPNHSPTHTIRRADGSVYNHDATPPAPDDPKTVR